MTPEAQRALDTRRAALCLQLQAQRKIIARQLGGDTDADRSYPRSKTMRLLAHRPELVVKAVGGLTKLLRLR